MWIGTLSILLVISAWCCAPQGANAQFSSLGLPFGPEPHCDTLSLQTRVADLQSACCYDCNISSNCSLGCATVLLPLMDDCRYLLDHLYDDSDGVEDGEASILTDAYNGCLAIPAPTLLDALQTLHSEGNCPADALDGVGETEVEAPDCADRMEGDRCTRSIGAGIFTCENDFCNTAFPPCTFAGQCDASCGFCGDDDEGHRRRRLAQLRKGVRQQRQQRQLQIGAHMVCDPSTFATQVTAVDAACCDDDNEAETCSTGVPTVCDAKCAVTFDSFYVRCQRFMAAQFSQQEMASFDQLYITCTASLPSEPLLRAAILCSSDPCIGVDCSGHGSCVVHDDGEGICECEGGYSGEQCEVHDPCYGIECGENGACAADREVGHCECNERYTGEHCEMLQCPELQAPHEGSVTVSDVNRTEGSTSTYSCDSGSAPHGGDIERVCQEDGSWSGAAPQCGGLPCCSQYCPAQRGYCGTTSSWGSGCGSGCCGGCTGDCSNTCGGGCSQGDCPNCRTSC